VPSREPLADLDDLADVWRDPQQPLDDPEVQARCERLLAVASAKLRQRAPYDVDARIGLLSTDPADPAALDPQLVASVVANVVKRFLINPEGVVSQSDGVGPFPYSRNFVGMAARTGGQDERGQVIVTDDDLDQLRPAERALRGGRRVTLHPTRMMNPTSQWWRGSTVNPATGLPDASYEPEFAEESAGWDPSFDPDPTNDWPVR
jgi:hypothetical protein